jgi:uncharacterized membrane protein (Fun14 family)
MIAAPSYQQEKRFLTAYGDNRQERQYNSLTSAVEGVYFLSLCKPDTVGIVKLNTCPQLNALSQNLQNDFKSTYD